METVIYFIIKLSSILFILIIIFLFRSNNPILLCLSLIMLSLLSGVRLASSFSKWVIIAILLIFLGGIIIIFIYVTAIAGRQKFFIKTSLNTLTFLISSFILVILTPRVSLRNPLLAPLTELFNFSAPILMFLVFILLLTLVLSVKIVESFKGSLKFFTY